MTPKLEECRLLKLENIKDNLKKIKGQEKVNFFGVMANITQVNGKIIKSMGVDIGDLWKGKATWANGKMVKWLDLEYIQWKPGKNMKVNLLIF